jgi:uncharacterized membrane protein SirB2
MASSLHPAGAHRFLAESARPGTPREISRPTPIAIALRLSRALLIVSGIVGLASVAAPSIFRDSPSYAGNALGTYVVILLVALPTMAFAMHAATRGSLRAHFVWLGALCYLLYAAVLASFTLRFNALFLLYVASLSLAVASLVALLRCLPADELPARLSARIPVRAIGGYLVAIGVAFALLWLMDVLPALTSGDAPRSLRGTSLPTNAVQVLDFGFTLPLCIAAGLWLMRRRPWGVLLSGMLLVFLTLESVSVAVDQWFGHLADPLQSVVPVTTFVVLAIVGSVPMFVFLRAVDAPDARAVRRSRSG